MFMEGVKCPEIDSHDSKGAAGVFFFLPARHRVVEPPVLRENCELDLPCQMTLLFGLEVGDMRRQLYSYQRSPTARLSTIAPFSHMRQECHHESILIPNQLD